MGGTLSRKPYPRIHIHNGIQPHGTVLGWGKGSSAHGKKFRGEILGVFLPFSTD